MTVYSAATLAELRATRDAWAERLAQLQVAFGQSLGGTNGAAAAAVSLSNTMTISNTAAGPAIVFEDPDGNVFDFQTVFVTALALPPMIQAAQAALTEASRILNSALVGDPI